MIDHPRLFSTKHQWIKINFEKTTTKKTPKKQKKHGNCFPVATIMYEYKNEKKMKTKNTKTHTQHIFVLFGVTLIEFWNPNEYTSSHLRELSELFLQMSSPAWTPPTWDIRKMQERNAIEIIFHFNLRGLKYGQINELFLIVLRNKKLITIK